MPDPTTASELIKPARLRFGDAVGVIAPASAPPDAGVIDRAVTALEKHGFKPRLGNHVHKRLGFLAGNDHERAADIMQMFADREAKAIFCIRGGYGTARLVSLLDYTVIRSNPKILVGYSDLTTLQCALLIHAKLVSFHGPMLNGAFAAGELPPAALSSLFRTIMEPTPAGSIRQGFLENPITILQPGRATGELIGGNLSVLCTTLGTAFQPDFRNKILFLEDVEEKPYRYDRKLTHLLNAGVLQQVAGVAIGINHNCVDPMAARATEYRQTVEDVLKERLLPLNVPVVANLPFGHVPENATLPMGIRAVLDADNGDLIITESAVI
jgi:muramoyltetrapeptide carboxypeptidase